MNPILHGSQRSNLTNDLLRETFDPQTMERGKAYATEGRVAEPQISEVAGTLRATAEVRGSGPVPYRATLSLESRNGVDRVTSSCTCPVRNSCKHGAALGLVLTGSRTAAASPSSLWETELRTLLGQLAEDNKPQDDLPALALEIDVHSPRSAVASSPTVELRPMRMGNRERWAKTGAWTGPTSPARCRARTSRAASCSLSRSWPGSCGPAPMARRFQEMYHVDERVRAEIAVKNRRYACSSPFSQQPGRHTVDEVLQGEIVSDPMRFLECCAMSVGSSCALLCSEQIAYQLTDQPVRLYIAGG